jgi:putative oxidoreductase
MNTTSPALSALILRVSLGLMYLAHGATKLFVFGPLAPPSFSPAWACPALSAICRWPLK